MMGVPPISAPAVQAKPIYSPSVIYGSFAKLIGASGTLRIMAPFPVSEIGESPLTLVA
jgi:hypothetical protein